MIRLILLLALTACTSSPSTCPDDDLDGYAACDGAGPDCNDADPFIHPGATERCNGTDDNCDGDAGTHEIDLDGDGAFDCAQDCDPGDPSRNARDDDGDGFSVCRGDCDDSDPTHHPGAEERCDLLDNDCDGVVDDGFPLEPYYLDADGDGYGDRTSPVFTCKPLFADRIPIGGDCDDQRAEINAGIEERCNGVDDNCDGEVDEPTAVDATIYYRDSDGDGAGDAVTRTRSCFDLPGHVLDGLDCDDTRADRGPQLAERCDEVDNDCDQVIDEQAVDQILTWLDSDGDGFGATGSGEWMCFPGSDRVELAGDCDDTQSAVSPIAVEVCDQHDQDCDGLLDEDAIDRRQIYRDRDEDGFGDPDRSRLSCTVEAGWTTDRGDCSDGDPEVHPNAQERCNRADDDCDLSIDENAMDVQRLYRDSDGDGYGAGPQIWLCDYAGVAINGNFPADCDDSDDRRHPFNTEVCDGLDNDCDDLTDNLADSEPKVVQINDGQEACSGASYAFNCTECGEDPEICELEVSISDGIPTIEVGPIFPGECSTLNAWRTGQDTCVPFNFDEEQYETATYCYNAHCDPGDPLCIEINSCSATPTWVHVCNP